MPPEVVADNVRVSADLEQHAAWLAEYADLGFDEIFVHHVGQQQDAFIDAFGAKVLPQLRGGERGMSITQTSDLWWKQAVIYCLDVQTFFDGNGDGIGDFTGLSQRIDYLAELGVDVIWLMPFYPTADVDDGYDITDFYAVDPRLGTLGDFVEFMRTAKDRGMRVIADLVCNHTSAAHPWFQQARSSPDSPLRDFYVWRDTRPPEKPGDVVFPDKEQSIWSYDRKAKQYYLHRFYRSQPDLNIANPAVRDEIAKIMGFWIELGLSGFRVDAVPFLIETTHIDDAEEALPDPHDYLRDLRAFLNRRTGDAILLGEVNLTHQDARAYFGDEDGDEVTMLFDFPTMQAIWLALARQDAGPIRNALTGRLPAPADSQWALFLRNHDELTLDKLSGAERQEVFDAFGPKPDMQLYGRGIRRRLPPDARRRPGAHPAGIPAHVRPARHARPVLRRGDRPGRTARARRADGRANARCSGSPAQQAGFTAADPQADLPTLPRRRVRPRRRQRRPAAPRPGLPAGLHARADPPLPRMPRTRLGQRDA